MAPRGTRPAASVLPSAAARRASAAWPWARRCLSSPSSCWRRARDSIEGVMFVEQQLSYPPKIGPIHPSNDGRPAVVQVLDLVKTFDKIEAVQGISFNISKGEIFGLLGPNGAGKSTTINMMCGYLEPTSGDTIIAGLSVTREP